MYLCIVSRVTLNGYIYYFPVLCSAPKVWPPSPLVSKSYLQKNTQKMWEYRFQLL
jgi:hypothetical protein